MEYAFFALTIIALFIGGILYNSRKSKKKKLEKLKNSWGQVKMEDRRFEFIELYNPTANWIDISSWKVNGSNETGSTVNTRATIPTSTILL